MTSQTLQTNIKQRLEAIYGNRLIEGTLQKVLELINTFKEKKGHTSSNGSEKWSEKDTILITYGDSIRSEDKMPLETLHQFINEHFRGKFSTVHILPFFPYTSDDGFSVSDYMSVNPELGTWKMVEAIGKDFDLMFDLVINHVSQHSQWFKNYKSGIEPGLTYFIEESPETDLSAVVRPRNLPLLTQVQTTHGLKYVWTTFSEDQIDLNFRNPDVLVEMLNVLLFYSSKGAKIIRLDAIAFLWKKIGTTCLHLPQTHDIVKLMRDVLEYIDPDSIILTETNVPNKENLSYFGNDDEAHMVYQFSLPPLLLYTLYTGNSEQLTKWASELPELTENQTFFNFTASHDGIGVRPLEGLIPEREIRELVEGMRLNGAFVNEKRNPDGSSSPYELNITYFDALKTTRNRKDNYQYERFICSQTIMMSLKGIPAFYIHSLFGTPNYYEGVKQTGMNRTINRRKYSLPEIEKLSDTPENMQVKVFNKLSDLIEKRVKTEAFHPNGVQEIIKYNSSFFVIKRSFNGKTIYSVSNITQKPQLININLYHKLSGAIDLIEGKEVQHQELAPYQTIWALKE